MDLLEGILGRRSIRKFTRENVSDEDVRILLECAMSAPSAVNEQPWEFIVIRDENVRKSLLSVSPYVKMAENAPVVIIVCGNTREEKAKGYWVQDCSAASENLLLAAHALSLGAVWCGIYPVQERVTALRELLGIPEHVIPLNIICIGHTDQPAKKVDRFNAERIHSEKWQ